MECKPARASFNVACNSLNVLNLMREWIAGKNSNARTARSQTFQVCWLLVIVVALRRLAGPSSALHPAPLHSRAIATADDDDAMDPEALADEVQHPT